jgi:predicted RNase H-like HicB family nuclease
MKLKKREYTVIYEKGARNWSAYVPDLPGCIATAKTQRQLERVIREAIEFHIEGIIEQGEAVPEPSVEAGTVRVVA